MATKTQGIALNGTPGGKWWTLRRNHKLESLNNSNNKNFISLTSLLNHQQPYQQFDHAILQQLFHRNNELQAGAELFQLWLGCGKLRHKRAADGWVNLLFYRIDLHKESS